MFKKYQKVIIGFFAILMVVLSTFFISKNIINNQKSNTAILKIDDKASLANTNYRVNGLHVYDPTSVDKEDFIDGAEIPKGTNLSIFAYNMASEIHLKITHNGKVIADKDYPILKSDKDVEFFKFKVEGDITVETRVINSKAKKGIATVRINNDELATVFTGGQEVPTFADINFGLYDFVVKAKDNGVKAIVKVNDKTIGEQQILGGEEFTFKNVKVDGDVYFIYQPLNKKQVEALSGTFKSTGSGDKVHKGKVVAGKKANDNDPIITIDNRVNDDRVKLDIRYLDTHMNVFEVVSGNHYPMGMQVYSRVINASNYKLRLTAIKDGSVVDSVIIASKPDNDDASYFGLEAIELSADLTYVLEVEEKGGSNIVKPIDNPTSKPTPTPKPEVPKTYTLTIIDDAKAANTTNAVNAIHVYNPDNDDLEEYPNHTKLKKGDRVNIYPYNLASDIHLKIVHNGKVIVDKDFDQMEAFVDDDKLIFYRLTVEGDITITTSVGKKGSDVINYNYPVTIENSELAKVYDGDKLIGNELSARLHNLKVESFNEPIKAVIKVGKRIVATKTIAANSSHIFNNVAVKDRVSIILSKEAPVQKQYEVRAINPLADVTLKLVYLEDGLPKEIEAGKKYDENTLIFCQLINNSNEKIVLTASADGETLATTTLEPKTNEYGATYGGLDPIKLDRNIIYEVRKENVGINEYTVNITNLVNDSKVTLDIRMLDEHMQPIDVVSGQKYEEGQLIFSRVINASDKKLKLTAKKGDEIIASAIIKPKPADDDATYFGLREIELQFDLEYILEVVE